MRRREDDLVAQREVVLVRLHIVGMYPKQFVRSQIKNADNRMLGNGTDGLRTRVEKVGFGEDLQRAAVTRR